MPFFFCSYLILFSPIFLYLLFSFLLISSLLSFPFIFSPPSCPHFSSLSTPLLSCALPRHALPSSPLLSVLFAPLLFISSPMLSPLPFPSLLSFLLPFPHPYPLFSPFLLAPLLPTPLCSQWHFLLFFLSFICFANVEVVITIHDVYVCVYFYFIIIFIVMPIKNESKLCVMILRC